MRSDSLSLPPPCRPKGISMCSVVFNVLYSEEINHRSPQIRLRPTRIGTDGRTAIRVNGRDKRVPPGDAWYCGPNPFGRHAPRAARVHCVPGRGVGSVRSRRSATLPSGRMVDEAVRKPTSKPLSVSPCLRALRVNRPEAGQGVFYHRTH